MNVHPGCCLESVLAAELSGEAFLKFSQPRFCVLESHSCNSTEYLCTCSGDSLSSRLLSHWFWLSQAQVLWLLEFSYKRMNLVHCRGIMSEEVCGPNSTTSEYPCLLPPPLVYRQSVSPPSNLFKDVIVFEVLHSNTSWFHHLPFTSMVMEFRSLAPLENQNIIYHDLNKTTCWTLNFSLHRRVIICKKDSLAISPLFWLFWILLLLCNYFY